MDPNFICHHLNVSPSATPRKQPPRRLSKEHSDAIKDKVMKLKQAGAIKEVFLPRMASQHRGGKEEDGEVTCMCRFYKLEQRLPKVPFPYASD